MAEPIEISHVPPEHRLVYTRLIVMKREADALPPEEQPKHCIEGEVMLFHEYDRALIPGHIYSEAGVREAKISGSCEYHFDRWFKEGWRDPITGEPGSMPAEEDDDDR